MEYDTRRQSKIAGYQLSCRVDDTWHEHTSRIFSPFVGVGAFQATAVVSSRMLLWPSDLLVYIVSMAAICEKTMPCIPVMMLWLESL